MFGVTSMRISCVSINDESLASVIPPIYYKERINSRTFIIWTQKLLFLHTDWAINASQPLKKRLNKSCIWYYSSYLLTTMTDDTFVNLMQFFLAKTVVLHHEINKRITHLPVLTTSINYERVFRTPSWVFFHNKRVDAPKNTSRRARCRLSWKAYCILLA